MPLYHVNVEYPSPRQTTTAMAVVSVGYEVEAVNLKQAAHRVIGLPEVGDLAEGVKRRTMAEPYGRQQIRPDPKAYDAMAWVVHDQRWTIPGPISLSAIEKAIEVYCTATGTDDEDDLSIGVHHLLHGLVDRASSMAVNFDVLLEDAIHKQGSLMVKRIPEIREHRLCLGPVTHEGEPSVDGGKAAVGSYAASVGVAMFDEDDMMEHMVNAIVQLSIREGFDFVETISHVAEDKAQAEHDRKQQAAPQAPRPPTGLY